MILLCHPKVYKDPWFGPQELDVNGNHSPSSTGGYVDVSAYVAEDGYEYRFTISLNLESSSPQWYRGSVVRAKDDGVDCFDYEVRKDEDWSYNLRTFQEGFYQFCCSIPLKEVSHVEK